MLLGLAWHNTVLEQGQVVIKTAVIPSMNSSWAGRRREKGKERDRERKTKRKRQTEQQGEREREREREREVRVGSV